VKPILLVGMMGAGKTTVGRRLAARLGWAFCDSDEQVLRRTGKTVPEIFAAQGEASFRAEEAAALEEAVRSSPGTVVAVAGGAVLAEGNRRLLRQVGTVVWLRARVATLAARVGEGTGRPLLGDDPAGALERLEGQRRPLYEEVADVAIDVDDRAADDVVEDILDAIAAPSAGGRAGGGRAGGEPLR
jgi:shikimate kinase